MEISPVIQRDGDFVQSLEKGLAVLRAFSDERQKMTLSEVARATGLSKPSSRRLLLTLQKLGYVTNKDGVFRLRPRVLDIGYAYLSSVELPAVVEPFLNDLNSRLGEACSVGVFDEDWIYYIARASTQKRIMTFNVRVGTRIDPLLTALGRVILAHLPAEELDSYLDMRQETNDLDEAGWTREEFLALLAEVRAQGWSLVDQEVEVGVRTIAAPIHDANGNVIAGINVAVHTARVSLETLQDEFLPQLLETRDKIDAAIASYGPAANFS
jgi:IclR family pca regulon transcriptional regulator